MKTPFQRGVRIGDYILTEKLWKGTFSDSWRAESSTKDPVVIQHFTSSYFIEEIAKTPLQLSPTASPSIVKIQKIESEFPAVIWKYFPGRRLHKFVKELRKIKPHVAVYIGRKILEGLIFLTSRGKMHGGLRPTRILITPEKRVAITNYGVGFIEQRILSRNIEDKKIQEIMPYFPQEVLEDQLFDDAKSDIYAVGMMLVEMITGQLPLLEDLGQLLEKHDVSEQLLEIISKALADFGERYNHPNEMYQDLTQLLKTSKEVNTIYVPPPRITAMSMEAIPADSEEFHIYKAEVISARQTIDAEVVAAEPVEGDELAAMAHSQFEEKIVGKESIILEPTIDNRILDRLEKEPIWPNVFLAYLQVCSLALTILAFLAVFSSPVQRMSTVRDWPLYFLYALGIFPRVLSIFFLLTLFLIGSFVVAIPLIDKSAKLANEKGKLLFSVWLAFFICLSTYYISGGIWKTMIYYASIITAIISWGVPVWLISQKSSTVR